MGLPESRSSYIGHRLSRKCCTVEWEVHEEKGLQNIFKVKTKAKLTDRELSMHEALGLTASTGRGRKRKGVKEWSG